MRNLFLNFFILSSLFFVTLPASAERLNAQPGWHSWQSKHDYQTLVKRVAIAAKAHKIGIVTRASATVGAARVLNKKIPGNMVIGLYHPRFAVRMLKASIAAGIEAPLRIYITENSDGTANLSYKTPSFVFAPYMKQGGPELKALAQELDSLFILLAKQTVK